jgi:hypothetical protein
VISAVLFDSLEIVLTELRLNFYNAVRDKNTLEVERIGLLIHHLSVELNPEGYKGVQR